MVDVPGWRNESGAGVAGAGGVTICVWGIARKPGTGSGGPSGW